MWKWDKTKTDIVIKNENAFEDLTGIKFGKLTALFPVRIGKVIKWACECECGNKNLKFASNGTLKNGNTGSCGCLRSELTKERNRKTFKGIGELSGEHLNNIKYSAKNRKIYFNVTKEYLWELFLKQDRKCALSGMDIKFGKRFKGEEITASLDRIDSSIGYIEGNVQWVHKEINKMKFTKNSNDFIKFCILVAEHNKEIGND